MYILNANYHCKWLRNLCFVCFCVFLRLRILLQFIITYRLKCKKFVYEKNNINKSNNQNQKLDACLRIIYLDMAVLSIQILDFQLKQASIVLMRF